MKKPDRDQLVETYLAKLETKPDENEMQKYFEENTIFLPIPIVLNHGLHFHFVISKLSIKDNLITDFAYITKSSASWNIVLMELEHPGKKIFQESKGKIHFHSDFNMAMDQVLSWKTYLAESKADFIKKIDFLLEPTSMRKNPKEIKYVLVIGRGTGHTDRHNQMLHQRMQDGGIHVMTYDSIASHIKHVPLIYEKIIVSQWEEGLKIKNLQSFDTSAFSFFTPYMLKVDGEVEAQLRAEDFDMDAWKNGELLELNNKYPMSRYAEIRDRLNT